MLQVAFRYDDKRLLSRILAWWQHSDVSHCEVVAERSGETGLCLSASWLDGGVRSKWIELAPEKWRIYELDDDPSFARAWASTHEEDGYDYLGLLGFVFRWARLGRKSRWFCSEACGAMLRVLDPWRYDVATLESLCAKIARRVQ